jgi:hypothetical protein
MGTERSPPWAIVLMVAATVVPCRAFLVQHYAHAPVRAGARASLPHRSWYAASLLRGLGVRDTAGLSAAVVSGAAVERVLELVRDTDMGANSSALPVEKRKALYEDLDSLESISAAAGERDLLGSDEAVVRKR